VKETASALVKNIRSRTYFRMFYTSLTQRKFIRFESETIRDTPKNLARWIELFAVALKRVILFKRELIKISTTKCIALLGAYCDFLIGSKSMTKIFKIGCGHFLPILFSLTNSLNC